jgi:hypothetical protein
MVRVRDLKEPIDYLQVERLSPQDLERRWIGIRSTGKGWMGRYLGQPVTVQAFHLSNALLTEPVESPYNDYDLAWLVIALSDEQWALEKEWHDQWEDAGRLDDVTDPEAVREAFVIQRRIVEQSRISPRDLRNNEVLGWVPDL